MRTCKGFFRLAAVLLCVLFLCAACAPAQITPAPAENKPTRPPEVHEPVPTPTPAPTQTPVYTMPDYVGTHINAALDELDDMPCGYSINNAASADAEPGMILSQSPAPGTELTAESHIELEIVATDVDCGG